MSNLKTNTSPEPHSSEPSRQGRLLALDLGQKRVGVAVTDELRITVRPLPYLSRTNWKRLVRDVSALVRDFDAQALVIGLPLSLDGTENTAALAVRRQARNLSLSLNLPVVLQDERLTSREAENELRATGCPEADVQDRADGEAAALILRDYLAR